MMILCSWQPPNSDRWSHIYIHGNRYGHRWCHGGNISNVCTVLTTSPIIHPNGPMALYELGVKPALAFVQVGRSMIFGDTEYSQPYLTCLGRNNRGNSLVCSTWFLL